MGDVFIVAKKKRKEKKEQGRRVMMQTSLSLTFDRIEHSVCQSAWKSVKDVHQFLCFVYKRGARKHKSLCRPPRVCVRCVYARAREKMNIGGFCVQMYTVCLIGLN